MVIFVFPPLWLILLLHLIGNQLLFLILFMDSWYSRCGNKAYNEYATMGWVNYNNDIIIKWNGCFFCIHIFYSWSSMWLFLSKFFQFITCFIYHGTNTKFKAVGDFNIKHKNTIASSICKILDKFMPYYWPQMTKTIVLYNIP